MDIQESGTGYTKYFDLEPNYINKVKITLHGLEFGAIKPTSISLYIRFFQSNPTANAYLAWFEAIPFATWLANMPLVIEGVPWSGAERTSRVEYLIVDEPGNTGPVFRTSYTVTPFWRYETSPPPQPELTRQPEPEPAEVVDRRPPALPEWEWEPSDKDNPVVVRAPIV